MPGIVYAVAQTSLRQSINKALRVPDLLVTELSCALQLTEGES